MCKRNIEVHSCNHCCCVKGISISHYECVAVALDIQHEKRKRHIILSPYPVRFYQIFPNYLTNSTIFGKTVPNTKSVF